jgi:hypothetical protein
MDQVEWGFTARTKLIAELEVVLKRLSSKARANEKLAKTGTFDQAQLLYGKAMATKAAVRAIRKVIKESEK